MSILNFNPKDLIFTLDIGTRSVIGAVGVVKDKKFNVICEKYMEHKERAMIDGQIHDISLVASTVSSIKTSLEEELNIELKEAAIAAAGRLLKTTEAKSEIKLDKYKEIDKETIRSLEIMAVKKAEEDVNKETQGKLYCVGYTVKNYYLNGYVISNLLSQRGETISAEVIATFLPRSVVESLYSVMDKVGLNVASLTLEPIAAMEAAVPKKLRLLNISLVDVGAGTSDIAISSNDSIVAYGMVPMAGDEVTEAIVQNYLVDFNTAEIIKRKISKGETARYIDVLGVEGETTPEEVIKNIRSVVDKIAEEIGRKVVELNGGKSPSVVFLVGGGAHTPEFKELLAKKLELPPQRIAIKGQDAVEDCTNYDEELGSTGVTVLGIALAAIKRSEKDFIEVTLNDEIVTLFSSNRHTVMDVMIQGGISHKVLIGRNGKNVKFTLNGSKRVAFGSLSKNAEILLNGNKASIDTEVKDGDKIDIIFAKDGRDASPRPVDYVNNINSTGFYMNDVIENLSLVVFINKEREELESPIKGGDEVEIVFPCTLGDYIKYFSKEDKKYNYYLEDEPINMNYVIKEGNKIYKRLKKSVLEENAEGEAAVDIITHNEIQVYVNEKPVILKGKDKYVFIDVFDYIEFDLTTPKGILVLMLNDEKAGYYHELKDGDSIKIYWEKG